MKAVALPSTVSGRKVKVSLQPGDVWVPMALNHQALGIRKEKLTSLANVVAMLA
jgi:hypothetical protein